MKIKKVAQTPGVIATVIDNLNSDSISDALSAKQGKELKKLIDNIDTSAGGGGGVTGDTLPVGAIVEYNGEEIPENWDLWQGSNDGGTGAPEIAIGSEEPTGEEVLWINEEEVDGEDHVAEENLDNVDLNDLADRLHIGSGNLMANGPDYYRFGYVISIPYVPNYYAVQYFTNATGGEVYTRLMYMGEWSAWESLTPKVDIRTEEEFVTNEYIDGRRVYGKRINCGKLRNTAGIIQIKHNTTFAEIVKVDAFANGGGYFHPLPYVSVSGMGDVSEYSMCLCVDHSTIYIAVGRDRSDSTAIVTIYYTKYNTNETYFTIDGITYLAEKGMTWEQFINSPYSQNKFKVKGEYVGKNDDEPNLISTSAGATSLVLPTDVLIEQEAYEIQGNAGPIPM